MKIIKNLLKTTAVLAMVLQLGAAFAPANVSLPGVGNAVVHANKDDDSNDDTATSAKKDICEGVGLISDSATDGCGTETASENSIGTVLKAALNLLSIVVGIIAVIMIIVGGLRYVLSMGDSNNTKAAKDTILYAIIGLIVVAFAQIIVKFVLNRVA
jgi:hypothetical protein